MTFGPDPQKRPEAKAIVDEFLAHGYKPEAYTLYSYAGVQILKQAIEATKSLDPKSVAAVHALRRDVQNRARRHRLQRQGRHQAARLRHVHVDEAAGRPHHLRAELSSRPCAPLGATACVAAFWWRSSLRRSRRTPRPKSSSASPGRTQGPSAAVARDIARAARLAAQRINARGRRARRADRGRRGR